MKIDLLYPIKWLLKRKVEKYESILLHWENNPIHKTKFRRQDNTERVCNMSFERIYFTQIYIKFINKWKIK